MNLRYVAICALLCIPFISCKITFDKKDLLVDDGNFNGTWEITNVTSVYGGVTDRCEDITITISLTEDQLVIDPRQFRCEFGAYHPSFPLITLDRVGNKLLSGEEPAGVVLNDSLLVTWRLGTNLLVTMEIAPDEKGKKMRYREKFRQWDLDGTIARLN